MKLKIIEQLKFKLSGKSMPVIRVSEIDQDTGLIRTLHNAGTMKDRPNSLINTWDTKGYEKKKDTNPITRLNEKGISELVWVVSERGETVNLYTRPWLGPAWEDVIGKAATADDISESMDLNKSMRNLFIGILIGIGIWMVMGPIFGAMMS